MRTQMKILAGTVLLAAVGWFAGCNGTIDNEPNVVLEVAVLTVPPVTAEETNGICTFTITNASATFNNKPKNSLAVASPFNDIVLQKLIVSYAWDDAVVVPDQTFGIGGTVPANGSQAAQFTVVNNTVLVPGRDGHTASLTMTFYGTTVAGEPVSVASGGSLTINSCAPEALGACCTGGGSCFLQTAQECQIAGGAYGGDGTNCVQANCP